MPSHFRLATVRTRRRRLILNNATAHKGRTLPVTVPVAAATESVAISAEVDEERELAAIRAREFGIDIPPPPVEEFASPALSARSPERIFREILRAPRPLTWVFVGDSHTDSAQVAADWSTMPQSLASHIRDALGRTQDTLIDRTSSGQLLKQLSDEMTIGAIPFRADLLFIQISTREISRGLARLGSFEKRLMALVHQALQEGMLPILGTPPLGKDSAANDSLDELVYVEAVRAIAAEFELPLVDHWAHWHWVATDIGGTERWYDSTTGFPGRLGHEQMTRRAIEDLWLVNDESHV